MPLWLPLPVIGEGVGGERTTPRSTTTETESVSDGLPSLHAALLAPSERWQRGQRVNVLQAGIVERALDGLRDEMVSRWLGMDVMELRITDPGECADVIGHEGVAAERRIDIHNGDAEPCGVGCQVVVDLVHEAGGIRALAPKGL